MKSRPTVVIAMRPEVAELALPAALLDRLHDCATVQPGVITDFAAWPGRGHLAQADVLLTGWGCPVIDETVLAAAPRLRAIVHAAGTVKDHLGDAVWKRGITVSSAATANAYPVAQYTVSAILLAGKCAFQLAREPEWRHATRKMGNHGRTVGVIGASRIGRLVLQMLAGHGFRLLLADPTIDAPQAASICPTAGVELAELDELLHRSDVVTVHAPALPQTHHLLDDRRLSLLQDGAIVINTARGQLIDTEALARHCASGRIDAVLDVTDPEPLPAGHPLLAMPNVLITPHIAGALGSEVQLLGEFAVAEIERLAAGLPLAGYVRADQLALLA